MCHDVMYFTGWQILVYVGISRSSYTNRTIITKSDNPKTFTFELRMIMMGRYTHGLIFESIIIDMLYHQRECRGKDLIL